MSLKSFCGSLATISTATISLVGVDKSHSTLRFVLMSNSSDLAAMSTTFEAF
jgi:hypothetical protein